MPVQRMKIWTPQIMWGRHVGMLNIGNRESPDAPPKAARSAGRILLSCAFGLPRGVVLLRMFLLVLLVGSRLVVIVVCGMPRVGIGAGVDLDERRV